MRQSGSAVIPASSDPSRATGAGRSASVQPGIMPTLSASVQINPSRRAGQEATGAADPLGLVPPFTPHPYTPGNRTLNT